QAGVDPVVDVRQVDALVVHHRIGGGRDVLGERPAPDQTVEHALQLVPGDGLTQLAGRGVDVRQDLLHPGRVDLPTRHALPPQIRTLTLYRSAGDVRRGLLQRAQGDVVVLAQRVADGGDDAR